MSITEADASNTRTKEQAMRHGIRRNPAAQTAGGTPVPGEVSFSMAAALGWTMLTMAGPSVPAGSLSQVSRERLGRSA